MEEKWTLIRVSIVDRLPLTDFDMVLIINYGYTKEEFSHRWSKELHGRYSSIDGDIQQWL